MAISKISKNIIVVPAPMTAIPAAESYSEEMFRLTGVLAPVRNCIEKTSKGRMFIDSAKQRNCNFNRAYVIHPDVIGKRVVLVDDSVVRGQTLKQLCGEIYGAGAEEIHVRILDLPVVGPCCYGIDMSEINELYVNRIDAGRGLSMEELETAIAEDLNVDSFRYQRLEGLKKSLGCKLSESCLACLNLKYPTKAGREFYRSKLEEFRSGNK